jgi:hypothetical protein
MLTAPDLVFLAGGGPADSGGDTALLGPLTLRLFLHRLELVTYDAA